MAVRETSAHDAYLPVAIEGWHIRVQITRVITSPFINCLRKERRS